MQCVVLSGVKRRVTDEDELDEERHADGANEICHVTYVKLQADNVPPSTLNNNNNNNN